MAHFIRFQMLSGPPVLITEDDPYITKELTARTVESITVSGKSCTLFDSPYYGGSHVYLRLGPAEPFPPELKIIKSLLFDNEGTVSSQVTLYPHPFLKGTGESFQSDTAQVQGTYLSLKVTEGSVVFFEDENYTGEQRILLKGDEVQNLTAVKLTSIGKSMKIAGNMVKP